MAAGIAFGFLGRDTIEIGREFYIFWQLSCNASTEADLDVRRVTLRAQ